MGTKALTAVAQRASRNHASAKKALARAQDWRDILIAQDAQAIWNRLSLLVRSAAADSSDQTDFAAQELFLFLLSTGKFEMYVEQGYSSEDIRRDIVSLLTI
jgi:hypothetical protein